MGILPIYGFHLRQRQTPPALSSKNEGYDVSFTQSLIVFMSSQWYRALIGSSSEECQYCSVSSAAQHVYSARSGLLYRVNANSNRARMNRIVLLISVIQFLREKGPHALI